MLIIVYFTDYCRNQIDRELVEYYNTIGSSIRNLSMKISMNDSISKYDITIHIWWWYCGLNSGHSFKYRLRSWWRWWYWGIKVRNIIAVKISPWNLMYWNLFEQHDEADFDFVMKNQWKLIKLFKSMPHRILWDREIAEIFLNNNTLNYYAILCSSMYTSLIYFLNFI